MNHNTHLPPVLESERHHSVHAWSTVAILTILYCFSSLDRQMMALLVVPIKQDLGFSDVQIGILQGAAFALFFVLASPLVGWLVDRVSRPLIIFWGVIAWSFAAAGSGLAQNFGQMFAARAGVGAGEATLQPAAFAIIADLFSSERLSLPMSIFVIGSTVGSGLSMILGGIIVEWASGYDGVAAPLTKGLEPWQLAFVVTGLPGLVLAFLIFAAPKRHRPVTEVAPAPSTFADTGRHYRNHLRFYLTHNLGFAMCIAFVIGLLAWNPAFLSRNYGWSPARIGLWLGGTQILTSVLALLFHGYAVDRLFQRGFRDAHLRWFTLMCPIAGLLAAAGYLVSSPILMLILFNLGLFCIIGYPGVGAASLQIATPARLRGKVSSIYLIGLNLIGALLGPLIIAAITDYVFGDEQAIGYSMSLFSIGLMAISTGCFALGLPAMRAAIAHISDAEPSNPRASA